MAFWDDPWGHVGSFLQKSWHTVLAVGAGVGVAIATGNVYLGVLTYGGVKSGLDYYDPVRVAAAPPQAPPAAAPPQAGHINVRQALPGRFRSYGRVKVGGPVAFERSDGSDNLWVWVLQGQGPIDGVDRHFIGDSEVHVDPSTHNVISQAYGGITQSDGWIQVYNQLGTSSQATPSALASAFSSDITSNHRWRGVPNTVLKYRDPGTTAQAEAIFPNGTEPYSCVQRAAPCWNIGTANPDGDPDNPPASWSWGQDASSLILDFIRHPDGFGRRASRAMTPIALFNQLSFINFRSTCTQAVTLKAGGSVDRYNLGGSYDLNTPPRDVLQAMLDACDGELYRLGDGTIGIRGGAWTAPTLTLTARDVLSHSLQYGVATHYACNIINAKYADRQIGSSAGAETYQLADMDPWRDDANIALRGEELPISLDLSWVPNHSQARRIAKIQMYKRNPEWSGEIVTGPRGLLAYGERIITLQLPDLSINHSFLVTSFEPSSDLKSVRIGLSSFVSTAYDWDAATEEGTAPAVAA